MIEAALAKKFIEQVTQYTDYNINIMDENGVIIASQDPERVGDFHEVAYYIVTGSEDMVVTSNSQDYPGVKPGVNMVIKIDERREGVVGITGDPESIKPVALITKMAIEAMLKYENQREERRCRQNRKEQLIYFLTQEACGDPGTLRNLARQLRYSEDWVRIPILCKLEAEDTEPFFHLIREGAHHSSEDISLVLDEEHILIFKTMRGLDSELFANYKYEVADYLSTALRWLRKEEKKAQFYIGSFQSSFSQYYYAYRHCKWLEETVNIKGTWEFFYDYCDRYIRSVVPVKELQQMFQVYQKELDKTFQTSFLEIGGALIAHNYNLVLAAKALFVHKNTLIYRYQKIKNRLNIDPIARAEDRFFMESLYYFLTKEH